MKLLKTILFSHCLLFFGVTNIQAQQGADASGGDASGTGGTASYTIGQVGYIAATGSGGYIIQGIQQPYEIFPLGIDEIKDISLSAVAYPNPTISTMSLKIDNQNLNNLSFQLYDIEGKRILNQKINNSITAIPMENLPSAAYFLKVISNNIEVKTFKIIKN